MDLELSHYPIFTTQLLLPQIHNNDIIAISMEIYKKLKNMLEDKSIFNFVNFVFCMYKYMFFFTYLYHSYDNYQGIGHP